MLEHLEILSIIIFLFLNMRLIFYLSQIYKLHPYRYIKLLIKYNVVIFIVFSIKMINIYLAKNLIQNFDSISLPLLINILSIFVFMGLFYRIYILVNILNSFRDKVLTKSQNILLFSIGATIILCHCCKTFIPINNQLFESFGFLGNMPICTLLLNTELIVLFWFYFRVGKQNLADNELKIGRSFIIIYIISYSILFFSYTFIRYLPFSEFEFWLINAHLSLLFLVAPFLWTKFKFLKFAQKMSNLTNKNLSFRLIYEKHKITKREAEIIELLINGKSSDEITEILFISYHTVKNHISHIYEKLNIKTRYELIHLFVKSKTIA